MVSVKTHPHGGTARLGYVGISYQLAGITREVWAGNDRLLTGMSPERIAAAQARFAGWTRSHRREAERVGNEVLPLVTALVAAAPGRSRVAALPTR